MKTSPLKALCCQVYLILAFPMMSFAGARPASDPPPPQTPLDARNAFFTYLVNGLLLVVACAALAWLVWWGIRLRRK
jgi:hypothetical protein